MKPLTHRRGLCEVSPALAWKSSHAHSATNVAQLFSRSTECSAQGRFYAQHCVGTGCGQDELPDQVFDIEAELDRCRLVGDGILTPLTMPSESKSVLSQVRGVALRPRLLRSRLCSAGVGLSSRPSVQWDDNAVTRRRVLRAWIDIASTHRPSSKEHSNGETQPGPDTPH